MRTSSFRMIPAFLAVVAGTTSIASGGTRTTQPSTETLEAADRLSEAFEYVAETIAPSVVTIRSTREVTVRGGVSPFQDERFRGSPFGQFFGEEFFGEQFFSGRAPQGEQRQIQQGEGSGVVVSPDGYILTNNHVVQDATEVTVVFSDDRSLRAEVIGTDPKTDIAVIRVDADDLVAASIGDSDGLRVGQWVVAAGNPFGLSSSITTGIVSATGRSSVGITDYEDFIQTDAAINRGNSGGPLVNLRGEVVGINTAILSRTGGNIGIGFAIPINMAKEVMDDLISEGRVVRGYLGVLVQDLSEGMARSFGFEGTAGALVSQVTDDGPAGLAGLRSGDIITSIEGEPVESMSQLRLRVASIDPGESIELGVFRDGSTRSMSVEIAELPSEGAPVAAAPSSDVDLGMSIESLRPEVASQLGLDSSVEGVVISRVEPRGAASRAGLRRGDVITNVHGTPVRSASSFRKAMSSRDLDDGVRLTVRRGGSSIFVFLRTSG